MNMLPYRFGLCNLLFAKITDMGGSDAFSNTLLESVYYFRTHFQE